MNCVPQLYPPVLFDSIELHKTANKADRASVVEEQFILDICTVTFDRLLISTVMVVSKCRTLDGSRVRAVYSKANTTGANLSKLPPTSAAFEQYSI